MACSMTNWKTCMQKNDILDRLLSENKLREKPHVGTLADWSDTQLKGLKDTK